jgi:hypothetical protein
MKTWPFMQNPFLNATENSFHNAMGISTHHDNALSSVKADPFFLGLYNGFHPLHLNFKTAYDIWITQGGAQQSETLNITQLLNLLAYSKIRPWDIQIQMKYPPNTPAYKNLLPNHRKPFQHGTQSDRIHALYALSKALSNDEALAPVKTEVDTFYAQIDAAYNKQKESKTLTKNKSSELEAARVAMCIGQYADLGDLIKKYAATPEKMEPFFDLMAIRQSKQVLFTGQLKAGEVYTIVKHTFGLSDQVMLINSGVTELKFYLASAKNMKPGTTFITLASGEQTVLASALGKLTDTYLTVNNTDSIHEGSFGIELV